MSNVFKKKKRFLLVSFPGYSCTETLGSRMGMRWAILCSQTINHQWEGMGLRWAWRDSLNTGEVFVCFDGILTLQTQLRGGRVVSLLGGRTHITNKEEIHTAQTIATYKQGQLLKVDASLVQSNRTGNTFTHNTWWFVARTAVQKDAMLLSPDCLEVGTHSLVTVMLVTVMRLNMYWQKSNYPWGDIV